MSPRNGIFDFISKRKLTNLYSCQEEKNHNKVSYKMFHTGKHEQPTLSSCCPHFFAFLMNKRHPIFGCHLSSVFYLYWSTKNFYGHYTPLDLCCLSVIVALTDVLSPLLSVQSCYTFLVTVFVCLCMCVCVSLFNSHFHCLSKHQTENILVVARKCIRKLEKKRRKWGKVYI